MSSGPTFLAKRGDRRVPQNAGFMMIELLISILIMSAMSTVVLSANSNMSARLQTDNIAHQVALSIREAQVHALSATVPVGATSADDVPGYGVFINSQNPTGQQFSNADSVGGSIYNSESSHVGVTQSMSRGYSLERISAVSNLGQQITSTGAVSIYFHRPRPDAQIFYSSSPTDATPSDTLPASQASIRIQSSKGYTKTIVVTATGQVSVQ